MLASRMTVRVALSRGGDTPKWRRSRHFFDLRRGPCKPPGLAVRVFCDVQVHSFRGSSGWAQFFDAKAHTVQPGRSLGGLPSHSRGWKACASLKMPLFHCCPRPVFLLGGGQYWLVTREGCCGGRGLRTARNRSRSCQSQGQPRRPCRAWQDKMLGRAPVVRDILRDSGGNRSIGSRLSWGSPFQV